MEDNIKLKLQLDMMKKNQVHCYQKEDIDDYEKIYKYKHDSKYISKGNMEEDGYRMKMRRKYFGKRIR